MIHNLPQLEKLDNISISSQERVILVFTWLTVLRSRIIFARPRLSATVKQ